MKIGILKLPNRSKKGPKKVDLHIIHYLNDGKRKKVRLKGMFLYERPRTEAEKTHNRDINYEAQQIEADANKKQRLGYYDIDDYTKEPESVVKWCYDYISGLEGKIKAKSVPPYIKVTKLFDKIFGVGKTFADVTLQDAEKFKVLLLKGTMNRYKRNYKVNTVNTYLNRMKLMFDEARKGGNLTYKRMNVFQEVGDWKQDKIIRPYINIKEYKQLDENMCVCKPIARAFKFSILTGLRTGDLQALKWKDVQKDIKGWFIYVNMEKGGEPIRIALTEDDHLNLIGERGSDNSVVFDYSMSSEEYMYFYGWIQNTFNGTKAVKEKNNGITFHSGRASFITNLLMKGIAPVRVQKYVGHKDLKTTLSYYRGSTEMQEEDMQGYMDDINAERNVLKAKEILS